MQIKKIGQTIAGIVTKFDLNLVELKSREFSKIIVAIEKIDGVALT